MTSLEQQAVISVSDALVHDYLVENGHEQIAVKLLNLRKRKELPNLHGIDLKSVTRQFHLKKVSENQVLCIDTKCVNNLVFKYLLINGHVGVARDFKGCTQSRLKEDDHKDMHLSDVVRHYEAFNFRDRNSWVPIQEVFKDKLAQINELDDGQSEVGKALRYILESNIPVRKAQAEVANMNLTFTNDQFHNPSKGVLGMDTSRFSPIKYGATSDEFKIDLAREDLKTKAQIHAEKRLYEALFKLAKSDQWCIAIVGCYLSKYLKTARFPQKVFMKVAKPLLFKTGSLSPEELELISSQMSKQGKIDTTFLQTKLKRTKSDIMKCISNITHNKSMAKKGRFSLREDALILKCVLGGKKPKTLEEFSEAVKDVSFTKVSAILHHPNISTAYRWYCNILPVILSLFHGTLSTDFREAFYDYLICKKVESRSHIDWDEVLTLLPSCTKRYLSLSITILTKNMKHQMPLHQALQMKRLKSRRKIKSTLSRKEEVARIFDEIRGVLPMSEETKQALAGYNKL